MRQVISLALVLLLCVVLSVGLLFVAFSVDTAQVVTFVLLCLISIVGLLLCRRLQKRWKAPWLDVLGYFWLIKLLLNFAILHISWMPILQSDSLYDPVRYYYQAQELVDNGFVLDFFQINYIGILYYYAGMFHLLGHNPVIPALVNSFVTLLASLYLVHVVFEIKGRIVPKDWTMCLVLLLPEVVWYDVLTSRETLMGALMVFATLTAGRFFLQNGTVTITQFMLSSIASVLAIGSIRTSMLVPLFLSLFLLWFLLRPRRLRSRLMGFVTISVVCVMFVATFILTRDNTSSLHDTLMSVTSAKDNIASSGEVVFNDNSISLLLMPEGILESILYLPVRMLLYLLAPLPTFISPILEALSGRAESWQVVFTIMSSLINLVATPYALAGLVHAIRARASYPGLLILQISYWCSFAAIAGGNLIVHERYRVMATLLFMGCVWLSYRTSPKYLIDLARVGWYGSLALLLVAFIAYKA